MALKKKNPGDRVQTTVRIDPNVLMAVQLATARYKTTQTQAIEDGLLAWLGWANADRHSKTLFEEAVNAGTVKVEQVAKELADEKKTANAGQRSRDKG